VAGFVTGVAVGVATVGAEARAAWAGTATPEMRAAAAAKTLIFNTVPFGVETVTAITK
jgi:hypothetical protein